MFMMAFKQSEYLFNLKKSHPEVAARYVEKVKDLNCDPNTLAEGSFDNGLDYVPPITSMEIICYLVLTHSFYTKEQMRAYKSLNAFKYFEAGFVENVGFQLINDYVLIAGTVKHSMKARESKLRVWIVSQKDGAICTAHCTCMAGLGEVCSHIAAVLYAVEHANSVKNNLSCTDVKAAWPVPSQSCTEPTPVASMDWGRKVEDKTYSDVPSMNEEDLCNMLQEIKDANSQAALMRLVEPFASEINKEEASLPVIFGIYNKKHENKTLDELILLGKTIPMDVGRDMASDIEVKTQGQRTSEEWYRQRTGRITASVFKDVCKTSLKKPSLSLIKLICYPQKICTKQMKWGIEHEETAINKYHESMIEKHENFLVNKVGLVISVTWPQLGASPDGFVYCDCCRGGCLEVKCPFTLREAGNVETFARSKNSCLEVKEENKIQLRKNHKYYFQVQAQIFISNILYCDFVVWCPNFIYVERVFPDFEFWENNLKKALDFHKQVIMPELLGRYYTSKVPGGNITKWCFCKTIDDGRPMVQCDNEGCLITFFHIDCVNLSEVPKTTWICSRCYTKIFHSY
ncbi:uncharacterized protein isoform X1 [Leptinotarsa decemlineata]|uniref:uncharacterized protein isoform X1 n=2 Tax=Leptinotarsa decemlineata TaxID=7539 RepID=UPI003D30B84C